MIISFFSTPGKMGTSNCLASLFPLLQFVFLIWEDFTRTSKTEMSHFHQPLLKKNL